MRLLPLLAAAVLAFALAACATSSVTTPPPREPYVVVLGIAQDGGYPQAGCRRDDCVEAFEGKRPKVHVASLGIVDPATGQRWLIDATPDFPAQLHALEKLAGPPRDKVLDGILLTHAHIGHYLGLAQLGREVLGARSVPVFAMPRMRTFLEQNGPWSQLVSLKNIAITPLMDGQRVALNERISVTPLLVPHRDEFSETVAFIVRGPSRAVLWLPDIDKWEKWTTPVESIVAQVDVAFVDATFYSAAELPGRDLREIPHPTVEETMQRFAASPLRSRIRLIHLNQSNPLLRDAALRARSLPVAAEGEIVALGEVRR
ncbi:MAG TPA: MBL fold metallo-hydrolase [Thermoanaerobaculia bacterium]|nr:MBL fold metallo-hydrolase [Thermoanaerobaculia bacterium]